MSTSVGRTPARPLDFFALETARARALVLAAEAQRWDVVEQIAAELGARRVARSGSGGECGECGECGEVIALVAERAKRGQP